MTHQRNESYVGLLLEQIYLVMLFYSFGMNLLCTKRNEAFDSSVFIGLGRGVSEQSAGRTVSDIRDWQFPRFRIG